jgi:hypothetical protein
MGTKAGAGKTTCSGAVQLACPKVGALEFMRGVMRVPLITLGIVFAAIASGASANPIAALDPAAAQALDRRQLAIVRRAERVCAFETGSYGGPSFRACVTGTADSAVLGTNDPMLSAYHRALPPWQRYTSRRVGPDWRL